MNRIAAVSLLALTPALAQADSVLLRNGGEIKGEIVEQREDAIVLEVGPGRLTVPRRNVARIVMSTTDLGIYNARAARLSPRDVEGWLELALWAQGHELATQARDAYNRVLAVNPLSAEAHLGLGHVRVGDLWMDAGDANRARGLVEFEGTWMSPDERRERTLERRASAEERQVVREAEARAREAEARVREAEARARAAEADAHAAEQPATASSGLPYPYGFPGTYGPGPYIPFPPVVEAAPPPPPPPAAHVRGAPKTRGGWVTEPKKNH